MRHLGPVLALLLVSGGCVVDDSTTSTRRDMAMAVEDLISTPADGGAADLMPAPGAIGQRCSQKSDCLGGSAPQCWAKNILDEPGNLPTPGGYCTSTCQSDTDCRGQGTCLDVLGQKFCMAGCTGTRSCRTDYACFVLTKSSGYCFPSNRLTCNPTQNEGFCVKGQSACIRRAFDDLGTCHDVCALGTNTCPILPNNTRQHCVYINATIDSSGAATTDLYKGTACFPLLANPRIEGAACDFFDDCADGLQCNVSRGGDRRCRRLCRIGVVGACPDLAPGQTQVCKDVFEAGVGNPGLCVPQ